jgi:hypothetical protein
MTRPIDKNRINELADKRNYSDRMEKAAYKVGYFDGFYGKEKGVESPKNSSQFPNAYSAGYWDGIADANPETLLPSVPLSKSPRIDFELVVAEPPKYRVTIEADEGTFQATASTMALALVIASAEWWQAIAVGAGVPKR